MGKTNGCPRTTIHNGGFCTNLSSIYVSLLEDMLCPSRCSLLTTNRPDLFVLRVALLFISSELHAFQIPHGHDASHGHFLGWPSLGDGLPRNASAQLLPCNCQLGAVEICWTVESPVRCALRGMIIQLVKMVKSKSKDHYDESVRILFRNRWPALEII